jgi:hypothetical protein
LRQDLGTEVRSWRSFQGRISRLYVVP